MSFQPFQTSAAGGVSVAPGSDFELTHRLCMIRTASCWHSAQLVGSDQQLGTSSTFTQCVCRQKGTWHCKHHKKILGHPWVCSGVPSWAGG